VVKLIKGSRHHNMKELRSVGGQLRVLFAFDPHRRGILLVGDQMRRRRGLRETAIADALDAVEGGEDQIEPEDDLYLGTITRYVTELGGHIEVIAVFPEETVTLLTEPGSDSTT
jgi:hypothetical protein